ncbi:hypothetical protein I553_2940 [Mycobacterium xenopi 4042]|uniref:Uncharacterized protein n=1 Tax=Mycobacterium xenopi 4042 TaxID=1299334 RepID=X8EDI9_MYCXE|nr:hypothetical protein I553_2940 [Mycobacterium xenopi 4042]
MPGNDPRHCRLHSPVRLATATALQAQAAHQRPRRPRPS